MSLALAVRLAWRKDFWGLCLPIGTLGKIRVRSLCNISN